MASGIDDIAQKIEAAQSELTGFIQQKPQSSETEIKTFQDQLEELHGTDIWQNLLDHSANLPQNLLEIFPARVFFNRKGLQDYNEMVYENLHPAAAKALLRIAERAIHKTMSVLRLGEYIPAEIDSIENMGTSASRSYGLKKPGSTTADQTLLATQREINEGRPNLAAFYKIGGQINRKPISFWLTLQQPEDSVHHHAGTSCMILSIMNGSSASNLPIKFGEGSIYWHSASFRGLLASVEYAINEAIQINKSNIAAYLKS